jgi:hypothetical protein
MGSHRLLWLRALTDGLKEITPANGYEHDLRGAVYRGRVRFGPETPVPFVTIVERLPEPGAPAPVPDRSGLISDTWRLLVQGFVDEDHENPTDPAYLLAADVNRRIYRERERGTFFGHRVPGVFVVEDILVERTLVRPPDETSNQAYFWSELAVKVIEAASI